MLIVLLSNARWSKTYSREIKFLSENASIVDALPSHQLQSNQCEMMWKAVEVVRKKRAGKSRRFEICSRLRQLINFIHANFQLRLPFWSSVFQCKPTRNQRTTSPSMPNLDRGNLKTPFVEARSPSWQSDHCHGGSQSIMDWHGSRKTQVLDWMEVGYSKDQRWRIFTFWGSMGLTK